MGSSTFSRAAAYEGGDIELRFRDPQLKPLRADSVFLKMASPTVLAPIIDAESPAASYLLVENDDPKAWEAALELLYVSVEEPTNAPIYGISLDALFPAMPILHKYNFSKLLKCTDLLLKSEEAWKKGTKTTKHSFGEWLWLADELQMVSLHTTLATLLQDMVSPADTVRLFVIGQEVNAAAGTKNQASAFGVLMKQFDRLGVQHIVGGRCTNGTHGRHTFMNAANKPCRYCGKLLCMTCNFCAYCDLIRSWSRRMYKRRQTGHIGNVDKTSKQNAPA